MSVREESLLEQGVGKYLHVRFIRQSRGWACTRLEVSLQRLRTNTHGVRFMWPMRTFTVEWRRYTKETS